MNGMGQRLLVAIQSAMTSVIVAIAIWMGNTVSTDHGNIASVQTSIHDLTDAIRESKASTDEAIKSLAAAQRDSDRAITRLQQELEDRTPSPVH